MKQLDDLDDGCLAFVVAVVPRASRSEVIGWTEDGTLKIRVTAAPVDDAANKQLIELLAKALDLRKNEVIITAGSRSRRKRLVVPNGCENRLLSFADIC